MLLAGDIGGTKTALAVFSAEHGPRAPLAEKVFPSGDYPSLEAIAREYIREVDHPVTQACFAVAGPVSSGRATLTNLPWVIEESALQAALGLECVRVLNDVEAMATAVPHLRPGELCTVRDGEPLPGGAIAVIAPGTGLGEAFLMWDGLRYRAYPSEGSHVDFAATTPQQAELLRRLQARWGRVSYERVCAGRSIPDLYDFLMDVGQMQESPAVRAELAVARDRTPTIMAAGVARPAPDPLCRAALDLFMSIFGAAAGNLVLSVLATGGLYIGGGIPQRLLPVAPGMDQIFLSTFQDKGRLSPVLARVPIHLIVEPVALLGAAVHGLDILVSAGRVSA
ncbi:MAG TPA: glucokinase [Chloroflexota bacterium]|nr:glucokinase [Chloroflexota bacterium]